MSSTVYIVHIVADELYGISHIGAVYSSRELAEEHVKMLKGYGFGLETTFITAEEVLDELDE